MPLPILHALATDDNALLSTIRAYRSPAAEPATRAPGMKQSFTAIALEGHIYLMLQIPRFFITIFIKVFYQKNKRVAAASRSKLHRKNSRSSADIFADEDVLTATIITI